MNKSKFLKKNLPTILSYVASAGVVLTAIASSNSAIKAQKEDTLLGKAKCYIPTTFIAAATIASILKADHLNRKSKAALIAACGVLGDRLQRQRAATDEVFGEGAYDKVQEHIVKSECKQQDIWTTDVLGNVADIVPNGMVDPEVTRTFYEPTSHRYFESTLSKVIQAEYHLNRDICLGREITLNDYYDFLGLDRTTGGDDLGWDFFDTYCDFYWLDFNHKVVKLDDGMEVIWIEPQLEPVHPVD